MPTDQFAEPYGPSAHRQSLWDMATAAANAVPGIDDAELELPPRDPAEPRDIWFADVPGLTLVDPWA